MRTGEYIDGGRKTRYIMILLEDNYQGYAEAWDEFEKDISFPI